MGRPPWYWGYHVKPRSGEGLVLPGCVGCPLHQHFAVGVLPEMLPGCCCSPWPCRGVPAQGGSQPCSPALWDHVHGWGSRGFWQGLGAVVQEAGAAAQPQCCPVGCWRTKPLRVVEVVPGPWAHPVPRVRPNVVISQTKGEHLTGVALRVGLRQRRWLRFTGGPQGVILLVAELCFSCPAA